VDASGCPTEVAVAAVGAAAGDETMVVAAGAELDVELGAAVVVVEDGDDVVAAVVVVVVAAAAASAVVLAGF
jgi:hypothetical protein